MKSNRSCSYIAPAIAIFLLNFAACSTMGKEKNHAEIYFMAWNIQPFSRLSAADVRSGSDLTSKALGKYNIIFIDQVLAKLECVPSSNKIDIDARAVIDLYRDGKLTESFVINQTQLLLEKSKMRCKFNKDLAIELQLPMLGWMK